MTITLPKYLPEGAKREGPVRYYVRGNEGMASVEYRVGLQSFAVEYFRHPIGDLQEDRGRAATVGRFKAVVYIQPREPSDTLPPTSQVTWRDGDTTVRVSGDLPADELLKVARSLY